MTELTESDIENTGGITPQGVEVAPDGSRLYVANLQTENVSFLNIGADGRLTRASFLAAGVTPSKPDPTTGGNHQTSLSFEACLQHAWAGRDARAHRGGGTRRPNLRRKGFAI